MAEKIPPHNLDAERSVLGSGLLSKEALSDVMEILKPDDFYDGANKEIYTAMIDMFRENKSVDIVTVCEELKRRNVLEMVGGRSYVGTLSGEVPVTTNASEYAKIVAEKSSIRKLIHTSELIREKSFDENEEAKEIINFAEKEILSVAQERQRGDYSKLQDVLVTDIELINEAARNQDKIIGVPTGFKPFDSMTSGLQKSELVIVAARPAMGKTAFALNIALNAAVKHDASVLIFSLEMGKEQLGNRLLSMESRVEMENIKKGTLDSNDWDRIFLAVDNLAKANVYIDDTPDLSVFEIKNKCRRLKAEKGLDLVVVDYLQLMKSEGRAENRQQEISTLSRYLKLLAREMDCPVIVLSQLSRAPDQRPNHTPVLSDLRESGSIEQDADIVLFLYRDDYYAKEESEKPGICDVIIAKNRSGPTGNIELAWVGKYTKFSDIANGF